MRVEDMSRKQTKPPSIAPTDHGRRMTLDEFEFAIVPEGMRCELARGSIEIEPFPSIDHCRQVLELSRQLILWHAHQHTRECLLAGPSDVKLLIGRSESERHPDRCLYLTPPPQNDNPWPYWVPEIVIEVVSDSTAKRDYEEKPPEYLELGVKENWIIDKKKQQMLALIRWRGQWQPKVVKASQKYSTELLPGFKLDLKRVFAAAK